MEYAGLDMMCKEPLTLSPLFCVSVRPVTISLNPFEKGEETVNTFPNGI
jgi:hypothetical protein